MPRSSWHEDLDLHAAFDATKYAYPMQVCLICPHTHENVTLPQPNTKAIAEPSEDQTAHRRMSKTDTNTA